VILTSGDRKKAETAKELCENEPFFAKPYDVELVVAQIRTLINARVTGCSPGEMRLSEAERLRSLAEWWRGFAEVGNIGQKMDRLAWANFLERLSRGHDDSKKRHARGSELDCHVGLRASVAAHLGDRRATAGKARRRDCRPIAPHRHRRKIGEQQLKAAGYSGVTVTGRCSAKIVGGWHRSAGDTGRYAVEPDLRIRLLMVGFPPYPSSRFSKT
jgi:hypothetical protein